MGHIIESAQKQKLGVQRYLEQHKIEPLLIRLLQNTFYTAPENPRAYIANLLREYHALKCSGPSLNTHDEPHLSIFTNASLEQVFNIYDGQNKGYLNQKQFEDAMIHLGIPKFQIPNVPKINQQLFLKEAQYYLGKSIGLWD